MHGFVRQLFDYDGSNLFPKTRPDAFVSCLYDSSAVGITTIGELIDTSYLDPSAAWETEMGWEPEFIYRLNPEQNRVTGDASGTMKAAKISQIPGLKFDAVLSHDFTVTNPVGQATYGRQYAAGTLLEAIIIDMLTGGIAIYDVSTHLPDCSITATISSSRNVIAPGDTLELEEGEIYTISYGYSNFADGYFYRGNTGYPYELYVQYNSAGGNQPHFRNDKLYADVSILSLQLVRDTDNTEKTATPTEPGPGTYPDFSDYKEIQVLSGTHRYDVKVWYSAKETTCQPYMSNGIASSANIAMGARTFTFYIHGVEAIDVVPNDPTIIRNNASSTDPHTLIIETASNQYTDIVVKSKYDIDNNTSTGIWKGDDVSLSANVARIFVDGYFTPGSGYNESLFNTNNGVSDGKLPAGNEIQSVTWGSGAAATYTVNNNLMKVEQNNLLSSSVGATTNVQLNVNYKKSTVIAMKSNNQPSNVSVNAGTITLTGSFNASTDYHIKKVLPAVDTYQVVIQDSQHGSSDQEPSVHHIGCDVSCYVNFHFTDGYYTNADVSSHYSNSKFASNNPGSYEQGGIAKLDASCLPTNSGIVATFNDIHNVSVSNLSYSPSLHKYYATAWFENIELLAHNVITIGVPYSNSNVTANMLSGRPDTDHTITGAVVYHNETIDYEVPPQTYHFYVISNSAANTDIPTNFSTVESLVNDVSTLNHWERTETSLPNTINAAGVSGVGAPRKTVIAIAPDDYHTFNLNVQSNPIAWNSSILLPYSSTDNTQYRVFIDGRATAIGFNLDTANGIQIQK